MISAEHEQVLRERIASFGLAGYADAIVASARTRIRLQVTGESADDGETRLGGTAFLPEGVAWPACRNGELQPLIAQIVLRDIAHLDIEQLLPPDGRLLFFCSRHGDAETVLYVPDGAPVVPHQAPAYPARRVVASAEISLPHWDLLRETQWGDTGEYEPLFEAFPEEKRVTMLLGYSVPVHGFVFDEVHDPEGRRLLLQVDSEKRAGMMWGDAGRIHFWIREDDLRALKFGDVWLSTQCH